MHSDPRSWLTSIRLVVMFFAIGLVVSACSGDSKPFGKETSSLSAKLRKKPPVIKIAKIDGLSPANSQSLRRQIIHQARKRGFTARTTLKDKASVFISATLKVAPYGPNTAVAYVWDVSDKRNNRLLRVAGEEISQKTIKNYPPNHLTAKTIKRIAAHATSGVAAWLGRQGYSTRDVSLPPPGDVWNVSVLRAEASSATARKAITRNLYKATGAPRVRVAELSVPQLASPSLAMPQPDGSPGITGSVSGPRSIKSAKHLTTVAVPPVTGTSSRGNVELTEAIKRALRSKGVRIIETPTPSSYRLVGVVKMGPVRRRRREITINWNLSAANGQKIGLIQQKNRVIAASVAKSWGRTADMAARAAAGDIAKIIPRATTTSQR